MSDIAWALNRADPDSIAGGGQRCCNEEWNGIAMFDNAPVRNNDRLKQMTSANNAEQDLEHDGSGLRGVVEIDSVNKMSRHVGGGRDRQGIQD